MTPWLVVFVLAYALGFIPAAQWAYEEGAKILGHPPPLLFVIVITVCWPGALFGELLWPSSRR